MKKLGLKGKSWLELTEKSMLLAWIFHSMVL